MTPKSEEKECKQLSQVKTGAPAQLSRGEGKPDTLSITSGVLMSARMSFEAH
jgi:hypothetical protein